MGSLLYVVMLVNEWNSKMALGIGNILGDWLGLVTCIERFICKSLDRTAPRFLLFYEVESRDERLKETKLVAWFSRQAPGAKMQSG